MQNIPTTIAQTIDVLAEKFGTVGTHLWEILVRGKFAESLTYTSFGVIGLIVSAIFIRYVFKVAKDSNSTNDVQQIIAPILAGSTFFIVICSIALIVHHFVGIFAPEYALLTSFIK